MSTNGKGSAPRSCFSQRYRENYTRIFRRVGTRRPARKGAKETKP